MISFCCIFVSIHNSWVLKLHLQDLDVLLFRMREPALDDADSYCNFTEANCTDAQSIGTLTSWQILAEQLGEGNLDTFSEEDALAELKDHNGAKSMSGSTLAASAGIHLDLRSPSFVSPQPTLSGIFGLTEAPSSFVTPKQLHVLYKEYRLLNEIGSGAFGRVCKAKRLRDGKEVVVKEIRTANLSGKMKAATMDEVQVLAKMNHPNIVKYHDCFMDEIYIDIVMEYCSAGDIGKLIKTRTAAKQPLTEDEVMFLFVQICLALQYTHAAGVLHRDLKASNCMLLTPTAIAVQGNASMQGYATGIGSPLVKLGDFGVAKLTGGEAGSICNTVVGTPQYLPPEMLESKPYGRRSDVWALGCVLYELCTLKRAFESDKIPIIYYKITQGSYEPLPESCSQSLKELVQQMLSKDPQGRPTVLELLQQPYVRAHLCLYLDWARGVPEAHPEVLLKSLGETWSKGLSQHMAPASSTAGALAAGGPPQRKVLAGPIGHSRLSSSSTAASPATAQLDRLSSVVNSAVMPQYNLQQVLNSNGADAAQVSPAEVSQWQSRAYAAAWSKQGSCNSGWNASPRSQTQSPVSTTLSIGILGAVTGSATEVTQSTGAANTTRSNCSSSAEVGSSVKAKSISVIPHSSPTSAPIAGGQPGDQPASNSSMASIIHGTALQTPNPAPANSEALMPGECSCQPAMPARQQLPSPLATTEQVESAQQHLSLSNSSAALAGNTSGQLSMPVGATGAAAALGAAYGHISGCSNTRCSNNSLARLHVTTGYSSTSSRRSSWLIDAGILCQRLKGSTGFCDVDDRILCAAAAAGMVHNPMTGPGDAEALPHIFMADTVVAVSSAGEAALSTCGANCSRPQHQQQLLQAEEMVCQGTCVCGKSASLVMHADESSSIGRAIPGTPMVAELEVARDTTNNRHLSHVSQSSRRLQRHSRSLNDLTHSGKKEIQDNINGRFHSLDKWLDGDVNVWSSVTQQLAAAQLVLGNASSVLPSTGRSSSNSIGHAQCTHRIEEVPDSCESSCDAALALTDNQPLHYFLTDKHVSNLAAPIFWFHSGLFQDSSSCQQQQQHPGRSDHALENPAMQQLQLNSTGVAACDPSSPTASAMCQVHRVLPVHVPVGLGHKPALISTQQLLQQQQQQQQVADTTFQLEYEGKMDAVACQLSDNSVFISSGEHALIKTLNHSPMNTTKQPTGEHSNLCEQSLDMQLHNTYAPPTLSDESATPVSAEAQWVQPTEAQLPAGPQPAASGGGHESELMQEHSNFKSGEVGNSSNPAAASSLSEAALVDGIVTSSSLHGAGAGPSTSSSRRAALVAEQQEVLSRIKAFKCKLLASVQDTATATPAAGMHSPRVSSPNGTVVLGSPTCSGSATSRYALLAGGSSVMRGRWGPQRI